jgi:hypothetical protein
MLDIGKETGQKGVRLLERFTTRELGFAGRQRRFRSEKMLEYYDLFQCFGIRIGIAFLPLVIG